MSIPHPQLVQSLAKPGRDIRETISDNDAHMMHMLLGITGEVGELVDAIKKAIIYRKDLDLDNVIEELGDIEFYLEGVRQALSITREECLENNIKKLLTRYSTKTYSDQHAQERADKV